ncbi:conserved hypothetical protein [Ricinus communis]|uniref:Uncharacterized protein n=1 Tax=Ricinus communis TaxID=3988 RepID=B9S0W1_RICCO|nr:conserved hypothetical protein [Ricinus communis]
MESLEGTRARSFLNEFEGLKHSAGEAWIIVVDFNLIMKEEEKLGGSSPMHYLIEISKLG